MSRGVMAEVVMLQYQFFDFNTKSILYLQSIVISISIFSK